MSTCGNAWLFWANPRLCWPLEASPPWELVALELAAAIHELGEITGEEVGEAILDRIFGQFCLGK